MSLLLGAAWALAADLGIDPDVVLDWRGSKVAMWTVVAGRHRRVELLRYMVALSHAVWSPKDLAGLLGEPKGAREPVDVQAVVERAERISRMRTREVSLEELKELRSGSTDGRR